MTEADGEGGEWLSMLLDEVQQPLGTLELEPGSGAFEGLFEPVNLQSELPELLLDPTPGGVQSPCSWLQDSGESMHLPAAAESLGQHSDGGMSSDDAMNSGGGSVGRPASGRAKQTPSQGSLHLQAGAGVAAQLSPARTPSQQHSDNTGVAVPDGIDSSRRVELAGQAGTPSEADLKRQARLQRNRENAQLSRQRKKAAVQGLEQRCGELQAHNAQLMGLVSRLTAEVAALRFQLAAVCQAAGRPIPPVPSALLPGVPGLPVPPPMGTPGAFAPRGPLAMPVAAPGALPRVAPPAGFKPAVPVAQPAALVQPQQQPAARGAAAAPKPAPVQLQAPAAAAAKATAAAKAAAEASSPRKRARTAGTAVFALFTLFMFVSPFASTPAAGPAWEQGLARPGVASTSAASLAALPAGVGSLAAQQPRTGRALLQATAPDDPGPAVLPALPAATPASNQAATLAEKAGRNSSLAAMQSSLWNSTLGALWPTREPAPSAKLEALALQRLQELAPVALMLDADDPSALSPHPLAASQAFPQLADQLFASSGLRAPQTCAPVFELDASSLPPSARGRRNIERLLMGSLGMRGRSLLPAAPLPATAGAAAALPGSVVSAEEGEDGASEGREWGHQEGHPASGAIWQEGHHHEKALRLAGGEQAGEAPALVSILLPTNISDRAAAPTAGEAGAEAGLLASLGKVFVVMLHPRSKYVAYACTLQPSGLP